MPFVNFRFTLIIMSDIFSIATGIFQSISEVFQYVWWIVLPLILFFIFWEFRLKYLQDEFIKGIKWITLELRIPKENLKTPKAMEQVFSAVHSIYSRKIKGHDKLIKGKVQYWMSFEIVGHDGGVYFFIKTPADYKNLIESAIFSQYTDAEISEVEDYTTFYPSVLPNQTYNIWGTDFILAKDDPYPIRTYPYFEEKEEERRLDPVSNITEAMSKLKSDEAIWLQFLIRPIGEEVSDFKEKGQEIIDKMMGREKGEAKGGGIASFYQWVGNILFAPVEPPKWDGEKKEETKKEVSRLTDGERDIIKAIENKMSKLAFDTIIRFVYIDKADAFTRANIAAVTGAFKQFSTENLNALKPNGDVTTIKSGWLAEFWSTYKKKSEYSKKRKLIFNYNFRIMIPKTSVLCVEELATLYHVPTTMVGAPKLRRLEAKKGEPPSELPIE